MDFARRSMQSAVTLGLSAEKLTLGLPFYGRNSRTGDWTTYEARRRGTTASHPPPLTMGRHIGLLRCSSSLTGAVSVGSVRVMWLPQDLVQKHHPLNGDVDSVDLPDGSKVGFNGRATIARKTNAAVEAGLGGVMIWEAGQDCRMVAVTHGETTHGVTCPDGRESSLLVAVSRELVAAGKAKATAQAGSAAVAAAMGDDGEGRGGVAAGSGDEL